MGLARGIIPQGFLTSFKGFSGFWIGWVGRTPPPRGLCVGGIFFKKSGRVGLEGKVVHFYCARMWTTDDASKRNPGPKVEGNLFPSICKLQWRTFWLQEKNQRPSMTKMSAQNSPTPTEIGPWQKHHQCGTWPPKTIMRNTGESSKFQRARPQVKITLEHSWTCNHQHQDNVALLGTKRTLASTCHTVYWVKKKTKHIERFMNAMFAFSRGNSFGACLIFFFFKCHCMQSGWQPFIFCRVGKALVEGVLAPGAPLGPAICFAGFVCGFSPTGM